MTEDAAERWHPDRLMVAAILAGSPTKMEDLSNADRSWLVAGLSIQGLTAEDIADRLDCSLRLIRSIRAEPMTLVCQLSQEESSNFANELRMARTELTRALADLAAQAAEAARVREQRDRMIDTAMTGEPVKVCRKRGHVMDRYNTYRKPGTNKVECRACRREDMADYRARNRCVPTPASL